MNSFSRLREKVPKADEGVLKELLQNVFKMPSSAFGTFSHKWEKENDAHFYLYNNSKHID